MMTKQQEREALERIKNILADAGADSYQSSPEFLYQMLGRLEADCLYYLGNGGRFAGHLWVGNEREQIKLMRMIYRRLCEIGAAPEWMSEQQINDFAEQMLVV